MLRIQSDFLPPNLPPLTLDIIQFTLSVALSPLSKRGLEPLFISELEPKPSVSTNFTTSMHPY